MPPRLPAASSAPPFGEGEFLISRAAIGPVARDQGPAGEQAALDHRRDPREGRSRPARYRLQRANVAAGEGRADEIGALVVYILDAAIEDQARRLRIEPLGRERVGLAEQFARFVRFGAPAFVRRLVLRLAPPRP